MRRHVGLAAIAACLGASAALADLSPAIDPAALAGEIEAEQDHISAPELADRLIKDAASLAIFDLRTAAEFQEFHVPGAQRITVTALTSLAIQRNQTIVVYSEGGGHAAQAWVLLRLRGFRNVLFLREGIYEWLSRVDQPRLAVDATERERSEFARALPLCRFFGGTPKADVPRSEVPAGYWTELTSSNSSGGASSHGTKKVRRRGC